ncbi:hypothetical protein T439DRAFT_381065 [Meredithblackwellia eburnea MCA 4105]
MPTTFLRFASATPDSSSARPKKHDPSFKPPPSRRGFRPSNQPSPVTVAAPPPPPPPAASLAPLSTSDLEALLAARRQREGSFISIDSANSESHLPSSHLINQQQETEKMPNTKKKLLSAFGISSSSDKSSFKSATESQSQSSAFYTRSGLSQSTLNITSSTSSVNRPTLNFTSSVEKWEKLAADQRAAAAAGAVLDGFEFAPTPVARPSRRPTTAPQSTRSAAASEIQFVQPAPPPSSALPPAPAPAPAPVASPLPTGPPAKQALVSFAKFAKKHTKRALKVLKKKISSKSPKEDWPKTWDEYTQRYANFEIDIEDPPLPPMRTEEEVAAGGDPTPYEKRIYVPPVPVNEALRQSVVERLDLFGARKSTPSIAPSTTSDSSAEAVTSLQNHPAFQSIITRAKEEFDIAVSGITVLDGQQQLFLATLGMPEGVGDLPRGVSFCAHAILAEDRGLVVCDSTKDWRFANNAPTAMMGARFYAGVPLFAPTFGDDEAPSLPIGTFCLLDTKPHESFSEEKRERLREYAHEASLEIEGWVNSRMGDKLEGLEELFREAKISDQASMSNVSIAESSCSTVESPQSILPPTPDTSSAGDRTPPLGYHSKGSARAHAPHTILPPSPPESFHRKMSITSSSDLASLVGRRESDWTQLAPSNASIRSSTSGSCSRTLALPIVQDDPVSPISKDIQKVLDTATRMLCKATDLSLVYLVGLDLAVPAHTLTLLSAKGLPNPPPSFDPELHFKALRAPEGGLLFKNPRGGGGLGYSSGLLIPVLEVRRVGYVLCGYTVDAEKEFGQREMLFFTRFAEQLEPWLAKIGRTA